MKINHSLFILERIMVRWREHILKLDGGSKSWKWFLIALAIKILFNFLNIYIFIFFLQNGDNYTLQGSHKIKKKTIYWEIKSGFFSPISLKDYKHLNSVGRDRLFNKLYLTNPNQLKNVLKLCYTKTSRWIKIFSIVFKIWEDYTRIINIKRKGTIHLVN